MATANKIKVAILGGSGYGGSELLRILLFHPNVEVVFVTANEHAGKSVGEVHRNLQGLTDLTFIKQPETFAGVDCVFLALPHGQAMSMERFAFSVQHLDLRSGFALVITASSSSPVMVL